LKHVVGIDGGPGPHDWLALSDAVEAVAHHGFRSELAGLDAVRDFGGGELVEVRHSIFPPSRPRSSRPSTSFLASSKTWMAGTSPAMTNFPSSPSPFRPRCRRSCRTRRPNTVPSRPDS